MDEAEFILTIHTMQISEWLDDEVEDDRLKNVLIVDLPNEAMRFVYENDDELINDEILLYYE
jgi:hypothetical protein